MQEVTISCLANPDVDYMKKSNDVFGTGEVVIKAGALWGLDQTV